MPSNLDEFFAMPIIVTPAQTEEEWRSECRRMFSHNQLTQRFITGEISPEDFMDGLADLGENPLLLEDHWVEGRSFLLPS